MRGARLDWGLTILVAFSFLVHFGIAGAMYSDWMDSIVASDDRTALGLVDDIARLPRPAPEPTPDPAPQPVERANPEPTVINAAPPPPTTTTKRDPRPTKLDGKRVDDADAAALAAKADRLQVDLLAAREGGPAVQRALDRTSVPLVDLGPAAAKNIGATHDPSSDLKVAAGGPVQAGPGSLGALAGTTHRTGRDNAGPEAAPAGPTLRIDTPQVGATGALTDADRVIAQLRGRFRKCYQDGLASNPTMSGKAVIVARVGPNGEVLDTAVGSNDGLSSGVTSCIARAIQNAQFANAGGVATLRVPVSLVQQR